MTGQRDSFMRASDAFSWYQEADPALRATIVAVVWLDRVPDWERLARRVEAGTRLVARLRQRVADPPTRISVPRWVTDDDFDLGWHLRRVTAPAPGDDAVVLELARVEAMTGFDRARPLWTYTLVDGLTGRRAALIMKLHHSLTDGVGAVRLAPVLFDTGPDPAFEPHPDEAPEEGHTALVPASLTHAAMTVTDLVGKTARGALPAALHVLKDPLRTARVVAGTVQSIAATVAPVFDILSPVMRARGLGRRLDVVTVGLTDLKRAAGTAGATVNDAFLAGVTGGMRRYHEAHDEHVDELRVTMPISIRTAADALASNRITLTRFPLPVSEPDPVRRMTRIDSQCRTARNSYSLPFTDAIAAGLDLLPTRFVGGMLKNVDFLASDVTGVPTTLYLAGAKVIAQDAFGPTMGSAANFTLMSYAGTCRIAINADTAAVPDPDLLGHCLRAGFDEVLAVAPPFTPAEMLGRS